MTLSSPSQAPTGEWLAARAAIAGRRSRNALLVAAVLCIVAGALLEGVRRWNLGTRGNAAATPDAALPDTAAAATRADELREAFSRADAAYERALHAAERRLAGTPDLSPALRGRFDSLQGTANRLDANIDRARRAPLPQSYRLLAGELRDEPGIPALLDSLDGLERQRNALEPSASGTPLFVSLTAAATDVGTAIVEAATRKRATLARELSTLNEASPTPAAAPDTAGPRRARDSARTALDQAETSLVAFRARADSAARIAAADRARPLRPLPTIALTVAALLVALSATFALALWAEVRHPTLASPREAEEVSKGLVIAVARDAGRIPRPGTLDPFRMLYLGLTATGTRTRTVVITGDHAGVAATVAGRLALAAGADARATLVVDADAENSPVAAFHDERPEPGFTDAVAGVRLWREVTRPIGVSDGVLIDVLPAGSIRPSPSDAKTLESAREEFTRFRGEYDLTVVVAPTEAALDRVQQTMSPIVAVLCVRLSRTSVEETRAGATAIRLRGGTLHGVLVWDAESPALRGRADLMARFLSRSKATSAPPPGGTS